MTLPAWAGAAVLALLPCLLSAQTLHVSTRGSDSGSGTSSSPFRTVQKAADVARPGDTILVHGGTYSGQVRITRSGTASAPITLKPAGDGTVTLTASLPTASCAETDPPNGRTLSVDIGVDHWRVEGLDIVGGVLIAAAGAGKIRDEVRSRSLPGRGQYDPAGADRTLAAFDVDPAEGWVISGNDIRGRGILVISSRKGRIEGNEIHDIACGTGGGIKLANFSDKWVIRDNHIHDIAASERHFMSEGIRLGGASMYNTIEENVVEDIGGEGRGYGFDVNSGWNVVRGNVARRTEQGFSEQAGGWGNKWIGNLSESNRQYGFSVYGSGGDETRPTERTPSLMEVECNRSSGDPTAFNSGGVKESAFERNDFRSVRLASSLRSYWSSAGNTWEGSSQPPSENPRTTTCSGTDPGPDPDPEPEPDPDPRIWGDINGDGRIGSSDALIVLNHITGLPVGGNDLTLADVNADGRVTSTDGLVILYHTVGLDTGDARVGEPAG
ncbi:MAG TPA: dockerin type I domain-containing protein [Gemmatimonadota bacterium]